MQLWVKAIASGGLSTNAFMDVFMNFKHRCCVEYLVKTGCLCECEGKTNAALCLNSGHEK
jgi:hypothetical protein